MLEPLRHLLQSGRWRSIEYLFVFVAIIEVIVIVLFIVGELAILHRLAPSCPAFWAVARRIAKLLCVLRLLIDVVAGELLQRLLFLQNFAEQLR